MIALWAPLPPLAVGLLFIKQYLPFGIDGLTNWGIIAIVVLMVLMVAFLITAVKLRLTMVGSDVEISEGHWEGARYLVPIKNLGPGDVAAWVTATSIIPRNGRVIDLGMVPVEYVRWFRGSGNEAIGTPNKRTIPKAGSWDLNLMHLSGTALEGDLSVCDGRVLAASPPENCVFRAAYGSEVEVTLQAFGTPPLDRETIRVVVIKMPSEPKGRVTLA